MVGSKRTKLQNFREIVNCMELCKFKRIEEIMNLFVIKFILLCSYDLNVFIKNLNRIIMNVTMKKEHVVMR